MLPKHYFRRCHRRLSPSAANNHDHVRSEHMKLRDLALRILMMISGLSLIGLGIAMFVKAGLGADPITVLCQGISITANISLGRALQLNGLALFVVLLIIGREYIGLGTFAGGPSSLEPWLMCLAPQCAALQPPLGSRGPY